MHMLSNSAESETVRVSHSPTTVVAANGEVQTNDEATVCVKELVSFVTKKLLEDTPAVSLTWKKSGNITDILSSGPVVRNHNCLKVADEYNAARKTTYRSLSLVYRPALPAKPHGCCDSYIASSVNTK